jgi:hypothetical protein
MGPISPAFECFVVNWIGEILHQPKTISGQETCSY